MALTLGYVKNAGTTAKDTRLMEAAKLVRNVDGTVRTGVLTAFGTSNNLVGSTSQMAVIVVRGDFVTSRSAADGAIVFTNDGTLTVPVEAAPPANSRIDVVYAKHNDNGEGNGDANALPVIAVEKGQAAASPTKPSIPTGAIELAVLTIPAGVTGMNASGVSIRNTFQWTAPVGGTLTYRTFDEMVADRATVRAGQTAVLLSDASLWEKVGAGWRVVLMPSINRVYLQSYDSNTGSTAGAQVFSRDIPTQPVEQLVQLTVSGTAGGVANTGGTFGVAFGGAGAGLVYAPNNYNSRSDPEYRVYFAAGALASINRTAWVRIPAGVAATLTASFDMTISGKVRLAMTYNVYLQGEY